MLPLRWPSRFWGPRELLAWRSHRVLYLVSLVAEGKTDLFTTACQLVEGL